MTIEKHSYACKEDAVRKHLSLLVIVILVFLHFAYGASNYEKEEAAVYRAYIDQTYIAQWFPQNFKNKPFRQIVIRDRTSGFVAPSPDLQNIAKLSPKPDGETIENFFARNGGYHPKSKLPEEALEKVGRYPLNRSIKFKLPHTLISDSEWNQIRWEEFYRRFPDSRGIVVLSRVGFNKNRTQALLYFNLF